LGDLDKGESIIWNGSERNRVWILIWFGVGPINTRVKTLKKLGNSNCGLLFSGCCVELVKPFCGRKLISCIFIVPFILQHERKLSQAMYGLGHGLNCMGISRFDEHRDGEFYFSLSCLTLRDWIWGLCSILKHGKWAGFSAGCTLTARSRLSLCWENGSSAWALALCLSVCQLQCWDNTKKKPVIFCRNLPIHSTLFIVFAPKKPWGRNACEWSVWQQCGQQGFDLRQRKAFSLHHKVWTDSRVHPGPCQINIGKYF
jgi:hypothetical protein